jgi:septal ring factor EnvC (AmiA/AmiB activator)
MSENGEYPIFYQEESDESKGALHEEFNRLLSEAVGRCAKLQGLIAWSERSSAEDVTKLAEVQEIIEAQLKLHTGRRMQRQGLEASIAELKKALDYIERIEGSYDN